MWRSSSQRFKNSNDNDERVYIDYAKSYGVHPSKIDVLSITKSESEAIIAVKVHYIENNGNNAGSAVEEWRFVSGNGGWYFDGSRTISESET